MEHIPQEHEPEEKRMPMPACPVCNNSSSRDLIIEDWFSCYDEDLEAVRVLKIRCKICGHEWLDPPVHPVSTENENENEDEESTGDSPSPCEMSQPTAVAIGLLVALLIVTLTVVVLYNIDIVFFEDLSFIIKAGPRWW